MPRLLERRGRCGSACDEKSRDIGASLDLERAATALGPHCDITAYCD